MTNQEAIASLRTLCNTCKLFPRCAYKKPECFQAIEMAISALQAQDLQPTCNNLATDTISRQAIINSFRYDDDGTAWDMDDIVYRLEQFPSAQPEQRWIPCSERLQEPRIDVWVNSDIGQIQGYYEEHTGIWYASLGQGRDYLELIVNAWMPLPEPYRAERRTDD